MVNALPLEAQDDLAVMDRIRGAVRKLRAELESALPEGSPEEQAFCRNLLDELGPRLDVAIAAAYVAVDRWKVGGITKPALLVAVKEPERLAFEAFGQLWDTSFGVALR